MKSTLSFDYLKHTAAWQNWISATQPDNISTRDRIVGRWYYMGWFIMDDRTVAPEFKAWVVPIVINKRATSKQRLEAREDGLETAWKSYQKELKKLNPVSIAPARIIPKAYKGLCFFL